MVCSTHVGGMCENTMCETVSWGILGAVIHQTACDVFHIATAKGRGSYRDLLDHVGHAKIQGHSTMSLHGLAMGKAARKGGEFALHAHD